MRMPAALILLYLVPARTFDFTGLVHDVGQAVDLLFNARLHWLQQRGVEIIVDDQKTLRQNFLSETPHNAIVKIL